MTYTWHQLPNYGYITENIPSELFEKLKIECEHAKETKLNLTDRKKEEMISGLSGNGIAQHYYVSDCKEELDSYTMSLFHQYENEFRYVNTFKSINVNMRYINTPPWINIQTKGEYIPSHNHDGLIAYVIWMKIPFDVNEERKNQETTSCFSFTYNNIIGGFMQKTIPVSKEMEGTIMMFPSSLMHQVYPFYTSDDVRISISGMISFDGNSPIPNDNQKRMYNL